MSVKITAPDAKNMGGEIRTNYGPTELVFKDGVATLDELPDSLHAYLYHAGYTVDGESKPADDAPAPVDARDAADSSIVGTELRDAAVDPAEGDFLAPVNAGEADPHGPLVVAPGIHAEGERVVAAGPVSPDPAVQDENEKSLAERLLIDNVQVDASKIHGVDWKDGTGPLGLSDPLSAAEGVANAKGDQTASEPKGNASREAWAEYAKAQGAGEDETGDDGLSRDDLRAKYGS